MAPRSLQPCRSRDPRWHLLRWVAAALGLGVLLALLGPFGSYLSGSLPLRLLHWTGAVLAALIVYGMAMLAANRMAPRGSSAHWPMLIGAILLASVPEALVTRASARWLWPDRIDEATSWPLWYAQTVLVAGLVTAGCIATLRLGRRTAQMIPPPSVVASPVEALAGDILALQMEDHYVRVHTAEGSKLVLMPLARAIETVGTDGLQTHRSWWIARRAIAGVEGAPRSMRIRLTNGVVAPVARSAVARLRAAGWLATYTKVH